MIGAGERSLESLLDAADVLRPAVVEGRAEADHQQLVFTDLVGVLRIVQRGVAGVAAEVVGIGFLALHQLLLLVGQGVPCGLGGGALSVGLLGPGLHVDGVDELSYLGGGFLVFLGGLLALGEGGCGTYHAHREQHDESQKQCDLSFHGFLLFYLGRLRIPRCM